jgi:hypothetical protein
LASNAVLHARTSFDVTFVMLSGAVRIEVADRGYGYPRRELPEPTVPGGRGMLIVDALARSWGTNPNGDGGKVVWAELETRRLRS